MNVRAFLLLAGFTTCIHVPIMAATVMPFEIRLRMWDDATGNGLANEAFSVVIRRGDTTLFATNQATDGAGNFNVDTTIPIPQAIDGPVTIEVVRNSTGQTITQNALAYRVGDPQKYFVTNTFRFSNMATPTPTNPMDEMEPPPTPTP